MVIFHSFFVCLQEVKRLTLGFNEFVHRKNDQGHRSYELRASGWPLLRCSVSRLAIQKVFTYIYIYSVYGYSTKERLFTYCIVPRKDRTHID